MKINILYLALIGCTGLSACGNSHFAPIAKDALKPSIVTQATPNDTDDPAIWIHPADNSKSLIVGTDKDTHGGLYTFDLQGKIITHVDLKRPNNVDVAYHLMFKGKPTDIAVTTERETHQIRVFAMPTLQAIDGGGITVFTDEKENSPMGIALYTRPSDGRIYAIVGRKSGPREGYLYQYWLHDNGKGSVVGDLVRKFGAYSGRKEIEAIAVDNELGVVYYSDEKYGVHKYNADPSADPKELALFAQSGFTSDHEGISIYKNTDSTGYILISNQQDNSFMVYPREGFKGNANDYPLLKKIKVSAIESDGSEVTSLNMGPLFPKGMFVAMSNGRVFQYYDWQLFQKEIDKK